ncbi:N-acetylglutamate kinase [Sinobaca qinghaiensis]|uniref:Acetylglutamate kinase n=1 Tax=Sinobaca qinghaiensis TaxID=342944 RepID=A0A419V6J3_9BACL|nr:acetylglutamate kinase [Sinobaca qinghaiensis]RKD75605.1 N-acetylglutamate kinase [Sinobaca qinghaiensis]
MREVVIVKCGGSTAEQLTPAFFESLKAMKDSGLYPIVVHGGGPAINTMLEKLDIQSEFVDGLRRTTKPVLDTAEMILSGKMNKYIVSEIQKQGQKAVGLSGVDGELLQAECINEEKLGLVGEINKVETSLLNVLMEWGAIPVIAPIATDESGGRLNVNADSAASSIATAMNATRLLFITDVNGIYANNEMISQINEEKIEELIQSGVIYGGMVPKVKAALAGLKGNIKEVVIAGAHGERTTSEGFIDGTTIVKNSWINS